MVSRREFIIAASGAATLLAAGGRNPVGCQGNAWAVPPDDFPAFLSLMEKLKGFGFLGIESNVRYVQNQAANAAEARKALEKTGLRFAGSHMGMTKNFEELGKLIDISASMGAERIVLSGSGLMKNGKLDETELKNKVEYLTRAGERCRKNKIRLTYHNHQGEFREGSLEMKALLTRIDKELFSLLFDAGHAFLAKADVPAFFRENYKRIDGMHMRDLKAGKQVPLGEGEFDQKPLAEAVKKTGWRGWLIVEEELRTKDYALADKTVQSDRKFIRQVFGS